MPEHPAAVEWSAAEREAVEQALTTPEMPALTDYGMVPVRIDSAAFTRAALDALAPFVAERERQAAARALREAEVERLRATVARVEALVEEWESPGLVCDCGHSLDQHNGLGCYAYVSYNPLAKCDCPETDDRYEDDFAIRDLRAALEGDR